MLELSNFCLCVQYPWKLTSRDFWSSRNERQPLSKEKCVLRKCCRVSQKWWVLELSNFCHCVQHPWKLTSRDFWSSRNKRKPRSKQKCVLRKCCGVSQQWWVLELSNLCHCVQHPWKLTSRNFWSSGNACNTPLTSPTPPDTLWHPQMATPSSPGEWPTWLKPGKWHKWAMQLFINMWHYLQWLFTNMYIHNLITYSCTKSIKMLWGLFLYLTNLLISFHQQSSVLLHQGTTFIHSFISAISLIICTPKLQLLHNTELRSSSGCSSMQGICAQLTGEDLCSIALCYVNICGVAVFNASMLDWWGFHLPSIYLHCPRSSSWCSSMQGICAQLTGEDPCSIALCYANIFVCSSILCIYAWLTGGVHLPPIYMHCPRSSSVCSSMQGICVWLTGEGHMKCNSIQCIYAWLIGGSIFLLYIYMHCPRSSSGCSSMQGICAQLTGEDLCSIALCYANIFGCSSILCIYAWLTGGVHLLPIYICIVLDLAEGVVVFKSSMLDSWGSICLLYVCIVLDLAVGLAVCKASVFNWLGRTYAQLHCAMLIYLV